MRCNYWSCSKFADRVRGVKKPPSLELGGWGRWEANLKRERPIRFWLSDVLLDKIQDFLYWPYDRYSNVRCYIRNRFVDKTHTLQTRLKKGQWHEFDWRLLHGCFEGLVDYVEVEIGGYGKPRRSRERGLEHLEWESNLKYDKDGGMGGDGSGEEPTPQAESAIETRELYLWWKDVRPNRQDPWELVENADEPIDFISTADSYKDKYGAMDAVTESYRQEDEDMMIRLIKHRHYLWS